MDVLPLLDGGFWERAKEIGGKKMVKVSERGKRLSAEIPREIW